MLSCVGNQNIQNASFTGKQIKNLNETVHYNSVNLSNQNLKEFPDLSRYNIKELDISDNNIVTFNSSLLPKGIEKIKISNNKLTGKFLIPLKDSILNIKSMDISNNYLESVVIHCPLNKLNVSNNKLSHLDVNYRKMSYIDISDNKQLSNVVYFNPKKIDTIKSSNISSTKPLIYYVEKYQFQ